MNKNNYYAFFDVDETVVNIKTMFSFLRFFCSKNTRSKLLGGLRYHYLISQLKLLKKMGYSREYLNAYYYKFYQRTSLNLLLQTSQEWFQTFKKEHNLFNKKIVDEINKHKINGGEIVFVSGSFFSCLKPIADFLDVKHILATELEERQGKLTGKIISQTIGQGKADAIRNFLAQKNFNDLKSCFAYGDHESDIPMLQLVGSPIAVGKDPSLIHHAYSNKWQIIQ